MAHEPFSSQVASEAWRKQAEAWITESLARHEISPAGPIEQPRIRPWSTQLTIPSDHGKLWFKATCPSMAFEPALQQAIARLVPGAVQEPIAIDAEQGWMLTFDHGPTLGDLRTATVDDWRLALAEAARVQRLLAGHRDELAALGLPDCGPESVVARFDRLVELHERQDDSGEAGISPDRAEELRARRPELVEACDVLARSDVPSTWQHGDLHPFNLHETPEGIAFFDLGDGMWSSAVEILVVPHGVVVDGGHLDWSEIVTAWTEAWDIEPAEFDDLWRASAFTHAVNRSLTWYRAMQTATAAEIAEWGHASEHHLTSMLDA